MGVNLAFAPVCDIDLNWRNPITNTRTYGSNPDTVLSMCKEYIRGAAVHNMAVSIKHFPGDGCDERDQHPVTSVNSLSCEAWDDTFGKVYKGIIGEGAQTVMAGHILHPAYNRYYIPEITEAEMLPASCSKELISGLLCEKLGFNGVVLTDAANMLGYCVTMKRKDLIPATINAGVDIILFGKNLEEDIGFLRDAVICGTVSMQRLDEAVTRILALKASLGLHTREKHSREDYMTVLGSAESRELALECANRAVTLVKDSQRLLPVTPESHKRIWLFVVGDSPGFTGGASCRDWVVNALVGKGFEVDLYDPEKSSIEETMIPVTEITAKYDLIMYFSNVINASYQTVARIQWSGNVAQNGPCYVQEIPTLFVSLGNPYGFVDIPMIRAIVNAYNASELAVKAVIDKLTGESPFEGKSPIDPFCDMFGKEI